MTREAALEIYWAMGLVAVGVGLFVTIISPLIKKLMHLDKLKDDNVGDDLLGQSELGEPAAAGVNPASRD